MTDEAEKRGPAPPLPLPEGAPAGLRLVAALSPDEQAEARAHVEALAFTHDRFRGRQMRRGYAQFGYAYVSTGRRLEPVTSIPGWLSRLSTRARARAGLRERPRFDQAIITRYPKGAGIGWHTDAPVFGELVLILSLGHAARMQLRRDKHDAAPVSLELSTGSALTLAGPARARWQHRIAPVKALRYSITLRHVTPGGQSS